MSKLPLTAMLLALCPTASTLAEEAVVEVGKPAPTFELPGIGGKTYALADAKGERPVVLVFSRAHWCPFCSAHMRGLQKAYPEIEKLGAELVVVFREEKTLAGLEKSRDAAKAEFVMVSDLGKARTAAYSPEGFAAYVIDKEGVLRAVLSGTKAKRPSPANILAELEKLAPKE